MSNWTYGTSDGSTPVYGGTVYVSNGSGTYQGTYYGGTIHVPGVGNFSTN